LVVNYSCQHSGCFTQKDDKYFYIHEQYSKWQKKYKKNYFDPFVRTRHSKVVYFEIDKQVYTTNVAQLNFIHWAYLYNIINYAIEHKNSISKEMKRANKERKIQFNRKKIPKSLSQRKKREPFVSKKYKSEIYFKSIPNKF